MIEQDIPQYVFGSLCEEDFIDIANSFEESSKLAPGYFEKYEFLTTDSSKEFRKTMSFLFNNNIFTRANIYEAELYSNFLKNTDEHDSIFNNPQVQQISATFQVLLEKSEPSNPSDRDFKKSRFCQKIKN